MPPALIPLYRGSRFCVTAYGRQDGSSDVFEFLDDRQVLTQVDADAFFQLFQRHADHGEIRNKEKCRHLEDGIWEYKAPQGGRIAWFYLKGAIVVCACGVVKKKQKAHPNFIQRAQAIREQCYQELKLE